MKKRVNPRSLQNLRGVNGEAIAAPRRQRPGITVDALVWQKARAIAIKRGDNLSEQIEDCLRAYIEEHEATTESQSASVD